jgi:hypothetical protein
MNSITRLDIFHALTLAPLYFVVCAFLWFSIIDLTDKPFTIINQQFNSTSVFQGDTFDIDTTLDRNRSCLVKVTRILQDADDQQSIEIKELEKNVMTEKNVHVHISQTIPRWIEPGDYLYYARAQYTCNPYHRLFGPLVIESKKIPLKILPRG